MDLVGPAGVVAEAVDHQRQVAVAALADRLAVVERLELGQLVDVLLDQVGELVHQPAAVAGVHLAPGAGVERLARGLDGQVDVGGVPLGDLGDDLLGGRVDRRERLAAGAVAPLAVDQHLGLKRAGDFAARFGDGGHCVFSLCQTRAILARVHSFRAHPASSYDRSGGTQALPLPGRTVTRSETVHVTLEPVGERG